MDGQRFDDLTRWLTAGSSRRRVLAVAAGLFAGATIAGDVAAGRPRAGLCRPAHVGCTRDSQCCSGGCETGREYPRSRRNRCCAPQCDGKTCGDNGCGGVCGVCGDGEQCEAGTCMTPLDCASYDGSWVGSGGSWCVTTVEGSGALSLPCVYGNSTQCTESSECAGEATEAGEVAVCATGFYMCTAPGTCLPYYPYPGSICVVTQTSICPV